MRDDAKINKDAPLVVDLQQLIMFLKQGARRAKEKSLRETVSKCEYHMYAGECAAYMNTLREIESIYDIQNIKKEKVDANCSGCDKERDS